ncbi:MAG TPA: hypothetical protein VF595_09880 [Tepidisphaeraceae bacterium]|jgi:hypothetical protein
MVYRKLTALLLGLSLTAGLALAAPATQPTTQPVTPYPLKTCIVSDEDLGSMGEPIVMAHEGREIKFCCGGCVTAFKKEPATYLKKLDGPAPTIKPVS